MLLKGFNKNGYEVFFTLADCPVLAGDNLVALVGVENSNLMQLNTIVRGNDEGTLWEGDIVYENDFIIGVITYNKGFLMQEFSGELKEVPVGEHIYLKRGNSPTSKTACTCLERTPLLFGYKKLPNFGFKNFLYKEERYIRMFNHVKRVEPNDITFWTGYTDNDKDLNYGEVYKGGVIKLVGNYPAVTYMDGRVLYIKDLL